MDLNIGGGSSKQVEDLDNPLSSTSSENSFGDLNLREEFLCDTCKLHPLNWNAKYYSESDWETVDQDEVPNNDDPESSSRQGQASTSQEKCSKKQTNEPDNSKKTSENNLTSEEQRENKRKHHSPSASRTNSQEKKKIRKRPDTKSSASKSTRRKSAKKSGELGNKYPSKQLIKLMKHYTPSGHRKGRKTRQPAARKKSRGRKR